MKKQAMNDLKKKSESVSNVLKVLAHPSRLLLLCSLADGEKTVGELEDASGASQSAVSQFLKAMKLEGLVDSRRDGQYVRYRISNPKVLELMKSLYDIYCR